MSGKFPKWRPDDSVQLELKGLYKKKSAHFIKNNKKE
jgi:hypothetical protein